MSLWVVIEVVGDIWVKKSFDVARANAIHTSSMSVVLNRGPLLLPSIHSSLNCTEKNSLTQVQHTSYQRRQYPSLPTDIPEQSPCCISFLICEICSLNIFEGFRRLQALHISSADSSIPDPFRHLSQDVSKPINHTVREQIRSPTKTTQPSLPFTPTVRLFRLLRLVLLRLFLLRLIRLFLLVPFVFY